MKKLLKTLLVLVVLGVAGYYGYQYYQSHYAAAQPATAATSYTQYTIGTGNLSKTVTGTGTLSISQTEDVTKDYAVTVKEVLVEAGEIVTAGKPLMRVDTSVLATSLTTLQEELTTCETSIATLTGSYSSTAYLRMAQDARVKEVYLVEGQYIEDIMAERGSIALLSLDGWMVVDVPAVDGMNIGTTVNVKVGRTTLDGTVRALTDGMATVSFSDAYGSEGGEVELIYNRQSLGMAAAHIHMPYNMTTTEKGYISAVLVENNDKKWENNRVAYLINVPVSDEYDTLCEQRASLTAQIGDMQALKQSGTIDAPQDGIVASVVAASTTEQLASTALCSLCVGDEKEMIVSVDELDIISVKVGQDVDIAMDAITDKSYSAKVSRVSQIGAATSGVTVYDVTLTIDGDDQLKLGMNGTATIKIEEVTDVLLVPISAMNSSRNGSYVWLYSADVAEAGDEPGVRTYIETGLSDEDYAEVKSGLSAGDVVLLTREASTTTASETGMDFGMMMNMGGDMPGGDVPAGMTPPSGTGGGRTGTGSDRPSRN